MNVLSFKKEDVKTKNGFKFLIGLLSVNLIWVIYELGKYIQYLADRKFLLDFTTWGEINIVENIMYLFANITGLIGIFVFILALIQLIRGKCAKSMIMNSFLFQLISCSALLVDSILTVTIPTYMQGMTWNAMIFSLFGNLILVITLFALILYIVKTSTKKTAIVAATAMTMVDIAVILDLFIINLSTAAGFFFMLSLSIKMIYILISIATLITIAYTEFKEKKK